jgi:hypothetical protein
MAASIGDFKKKKRATEILHSHFVVSLNSLEALYSFVYQKKAPWSGAPWGFWFF